MPFLPALIAYWVRLIFRPIDTRLKLGRVGGSVIVAGFGVVVAFWVRLRPPGYSFWYAQGELGGVLGIYLLSWSLLLAARARWMERWFGGLDRMYLWHRRCATLGMLILIVHAAVTDKGTPAGAPPPQVGMALGGLSLAGLVLLTAISVAKLGSIVRIPYERWLFLHRLIGLFVFIGLLHGLIVDSIIASSLTLRIVYAVIGSVGMGSYLYDELFMRRRVPLAEYTISAVSRPKDDVVEMELTPAGKDGIRPVPGQFVFLRIGGEHAWRQHPFSIAGRDESGRLRLSVRALGTDTRRMHELLAPGTPATVSGPYGMFDYTLGGLEQVWIAGGIGVVPFLSWLQSLTPEDEHKIQLFYSTRSDADAIYLPDLLAHRDRLRSVQVHHVATDHSSHLNGERVMEAVAGAAAKIHVFMCGPHSMVDNITRDLRHRGVPRDQIHAENFAFR